MICDPIHRVNIKTFDSTNVKEKSSGSGKKAKGKKKCTLAQKQLDLARVRGCDFKQLFKYDIVPSSYLFDENNLMTKPEKVN